MTATGLPDEVYIDIQSLFRATPMLLVGSGFSCGYGLPHMGALGQHLAEVVGPRLASDEAKAVWRAALEAIRENLEAGLNTIASGAQGRDEIITILREETAKHITEKTLAAEAVIINHPTPSTHAPARLLRRLFDGAPQNADSISVITTNYDTLLELFCDIADVPLDTGFSGFRRRKPRANSLFQTQYSRIWAADKKGTQAEHRPCKTIRLHKPHGSITWHATKDGPIEVINDVSMAPKAIVVPGPSKYQDALVNTLFDAMRTEMNAALNRADALVCIGFGFNDDHLQGAIKARLDSHMPMLILTRELTDSIKDLLLCYPHVAAFYKNGDGCKCLHNGKLLSSTQPLWQLDDFMKAFLE
jgi:hypothetical protein